jgi:hypothetical protein
VKACRILVTALLIAAAPPSLAAETPLDVSGVTHVNVTGDASRVSFTTAEGEPNLARLASHPSGWPLRWLTGWFLKDCRTASDMSVSGTTLTIRVSPAPLTEFADCTVSVEANLPVGGDIAIDQTATKASFQGDFGTILLKGTAADVDLRGHATSVVSHADAMRVKIHFTSAGKDESISLTSKALDADLSFGGRAVSYRIDATASMVDTTLANTPGAKPSIDIKADFARTKIR